MTALEALAQRCGIALSVPDGRGGERRAAPDTLRAVLAALGIDASSEQRAAEALAEREQREWQAVLAPAVVANESAVVVDLTLPAAARAVAWHLRCEDGTERMGEAAFGELELVAQNRGDGSALRKERRRLALGRVPVGYHQLTIEPQGAIATLIVTPARCYLPEVDDERGFWGLAVQLYLLKSERNLGVGDFGDLRVLAAELARRGCAMLGLNPMHAPFPDDPEHASPYSPASRLLLNPLNIDVAAPELRASPAAAALLDDAAFKAEAESCRAAATLDYRRVAALKQRALRGAYSAWRSAATAAEAAELASFRAARGAAFERHCLYFALRAHMLVEGLGPGDWHGWPQPYRDPRAPVVERFARTHADEVTWVAWQQWLADRQLAAAAKAAQAMPIGFYRDLAVGSDAAGAETWVERELMMEGLRIGAPPEPGTPEGQEWGLPPPHPQRMRESGYAAFVDLLRANMRHAGALRIDHVMAMMRLYVIPSGAPATAGTYLAYPFADLAGVVALESVRHRCVVVGEDLGTVPEGFRERMAAAHILSYRVLRWQRDGQRMFRPHEYPRLAVAVVGNHDLATLRAWWDGADITLEHEHGALPAAELDAARHARAAERQQLVELLRSEGLVTGDDAALSYDALFGAVHALLGRTRALLVSAQLDDVLREAQPVNVPSTQRYPNWRRRYSVPIERLADEPLFVHLAATLGERRAAHEAA